jgi:hypothetical protein
MDSVLDLKPETTPLKMERWGFEFKMHILTLF